VKPLHLNLASRPYRDYRPLYAAVVVLSLATAILMLNNVDTWYRYVRDTRTSRTRIAQLEAETAEEQRKADGATNSLGTINLNALNQQTRYVNAQIAERAFSWSELLDRLEAVMPNDVKVMSLAPNFAKDGLVHLSISCISKTPEGMINTLNRLNADSHFSQPFPSSL
jgi:hypothetical protein